MEETAIIVIMEIVKEISNEIKENPLGLERLDWLPFLG